MADISKNVYGEYIVEGDMTQEDINFINSLELDANICLKNTKGISSELLRQITNEKIKFSVIGGLETRKIIYTTNAIESLNNMYKKLNKGRRVFTTEQALERCMYLSTQLITENGHLDIQIGVLHYQN